MAEPAFAGRAGELRLLEGLAARAGAGEGGAVWIGGDPGIGKSALIRAGLSARGEHRCRVFSAGACEQSPAFPLELLLNALGAGYAADSPAVPEVADPERIRAGRAEISALLHDSAAEFVTLQNTVDPAAEGLVELVHRLCAVSPAVLVVDDAQWADQASLGVLVSLSRALRQLPLLLVVAARSIPRRTEVQRLRAALDDAGALHIELGPLSPADAAEMVRQSAGVPPGPGLTRQLAAAGGNPLYLRELIDALLRESRVRIDDQQAEMVADPAGLPGTLPAAIGLRLGFLSESATSVLRMAAVLGPTFSLRDLRTVTGRRISDGTEVEEAVAAGVLAESGVGLLAFRHSLVHQTLYEGMPASLRAALHGQVAESLAKAGAPPEQVTTQLLAAPAVTDSWMIDWVAHTAPVLSRRAPSVAAELLERARAGLGWQDPRREHLDADLAMARLLLGDNEQVVELARPLLAGTPDPALAGRAAWVLGYALPRLGRAEEAMEATGQALARPGLPPAWSARLRSRRATALFALGRFDAARAEASQAEAEGTQTGNRLAVGSALYTLGRLDVIDRRTITAGIDKMERALAVLDDEPQATDLVLQLMVNLGVMLAAVGRPAEADRRIAQAAELAGRGTPLRQAYVRAFSATFAFHLGRWDDALAELDAVDQLPLESSVRRRYTSGIRARIALHRDEEVPTDTYLGEATVVNPSGGEIGLDVEQLLVARALSAERDGDPAKALTRLVAMYDPNSTQEFRRLSANSAQWLPDVIRLAMAADQPAVAAAAARAAAREADLQAAAVFTISARHCQGLVDRDSAAVIAAAGDLREAGYTLYTAHALENGAVLHAEQGNSAAARAAFRQAIGIYEKLGAAWDIRRADARLRRYNIRRGARGARSRPAAGWDALTPAEQRIARLVASGQSNPDIASQMFLSRYTIESHVSHILAKLNARSRFEIAGVVAARDRQPELAQQRSPATSLSCAPRQAGDAERAGQARPHARGRRTGRW